jgi:hypothetical protein
MLHRAANDRWMALTDSELPKYGDGKPGFKNVKAYYNDIEKKLEEGRMAKFIYDRYKYKYEDATGEILNWWGYTDMNEPPEDYYDDILTRYDFYDGIAAFGRGIWEYEPGEKKPLPVPTFGPKTRFNKGDVRTIEFYARSVDYPFVWWEKSQEKIEGMKKSDYYRAMLEELEVYRYDADMMHELKTEYNAIFGRNALKSWGQFRLDNPDTDVGVKDYWRRIREEMEPHIAEPID